MNTKNEIFSRYLGEYLKANKARKGEILKSVCETVGTHRKAAIRKFRRLQLKDKSVPDRRGRKQFYTPDSIFALKTVWETASEICGELIFPIIKEYVQILKRDKLWEHGSAATEKLISMSEATVKRKVGKFMKARTPRSGLSSTKPSDLKEIIPIFTGPWAGKGPGYGQIDTVVHCGHTLLGDMVYTTNYTDVELLWISLAAQWNKGQIATRKSLERIRNKTPFRILGMHPDTGSEFINWHLKGWSDENEIELTRSRPNHKNDNAYVEQKNGHVVRRFLGYQRLDCPDVTDAMNQMYDKLEKYLNHFVPSRKCLEKVRIGSKYRRKYDRPKTAYARLMEHSKIDQAVKDKMAAEHENINPLLLKKEIDKLITQIFNMQKCYGNTKNSEPNSK